jgi:antitoxin component YwqK of YwqJK toxin-antitoxin module
MKTLKNGRRNLQVRKKEGKWTKCDEKGQIIAQEDYKDGKVI